VHRAIRVIKERVTYRGCPCTLYILPKGTRDNLKYRGDPLSCISCNYMIYSVISVITWKTLLSRRMLVHVFKSIKNMLEQVTCNYTESSKETRDPV